jgi:hypothetical protein
MCLLGDIGGEILWWLCNLPTKIYSAKASEFLTWVRYEDRKRSLLRVLASTPAVTRLLCLELFLSHTLPLNYSYLDLDLVPITVSYRTETGHTLKEDLILTRRASDYTWASVFVKRERDMKT